MAMNKDPTFDQRLRPRGSLFVELYNPWPTYLSNTNGTPAATEAPGEFYTINTSTNAATGVHLNMTSLAGNSPVWRLLIVKPGNAPNGQPYDPDDPVAANQLPMGNIERSVYFTASAPNIAAIANDGQPYFTTFATMAPLLPGRYAVVGSAGQAGLNIAAPPTFVNTVGRLQTRAAWLKTEIRQEFGKSY